MKTKKKEERLKRLNLVLRTIRNVNQLLVRERDRTRLLQGICNNLIENRGYYNAWIALFHDSGGLETAVEAGLGEAFLPMFEWLKHGERTECIRRAINQPGVVLTENPVAACNDCPLSKNYENRAGVTVRLDFEGKVYGILTVSIPRNLALDEEEQALLEEIAGDVAFALHNIEIEEDRKRADKVQEKNFHELGERVKELNCLFAISRLVEKRDISLGEIFQGTVDLIPPAWQYSEITCARIVIEGQEFKTERFKKTPWKQTKDIIAQGAPIGTVEVYCLEKKQERDDGPFLKEEKALLNAITERIGRIIERNKAKEAHRESEKRFRDLVENSLIGICIIQDNRIVYQNPAQEKLLGSLPRPIKLTDTESIHPDDIEKVKAFYKNIDSGKVQAQETDFRFYPIDDSGNRLDMKWVLCRASATDYMQKGAILINMLDITHAKDLENLLRIQDKMSSLGRVAAGIAHEIRNPLSGINIYINTLGKMYDRGDSFELEKVKKILKQLQSASNKIESVIRRVMDFSKPSDPKFMLTDINQPIDEAIDLSSVMLRKRGIMLEKTLTEEIKPCRADPNMIEQVILNLITNAAEALKNVEKNKMIKVTSSLENGQIIVRVSDSGPGVPSNLSGKIFDPFYTTKNGSTGIGLSLCHRIIMDHGGLVNVSPSKWGGAEFTIEIPLLNE